MTKTIVAIYNNKEQAQNAKEQLLKEGFAGSDIDVSAGRSNAENTYEEESGISRFFKNLFGDSDDRSERYSRVAAQGYVVTVYTHSNEDAQRASNLLDQYGAIDVDESYDKQLTDSDRYDRKSNKSYNTTNDNLVDDVNDSNRVIPVIEEDISIGKREVTTGGVRLRSRIIEKPVEENLRLREERIHIERNQVDRPATEADLNNFRNTTVEVTSNAEIPEIQKTSRVVEEVSLEKEVSHRDEIVRDKVRKTQVDVEDITPNDRLSNSDL